MKRLALILVLLATPAFAEVQVDARLEKTQYLEGEPIVVVVDILNVGDEAVGYSRCDGDVRLTVIGVARRVLPNIVGCFNGIGVGPGLCGVDHPPLLAPGQRTSFNYVLRATISGQDSTVSLHRARPGFAGSTILLITPAFPLHHHLDIEKRIPFPARSSRELCLSP